MSRNSSSSSSPSSDGFFFFSIACLTSRPSSFIFTTYSVTSILLLLPLCIFILHHGLQQWRQKKRSTSSAATVSHSDVFTYHMVIMELAGVCGSVLCCCAVYVEEARLSLGFFLINFIWFGETFFHILTCVERYLAVVHPITYLSLRNQRGIRIRNISIACVWMFCFVGMVLHVMKDSIIVDVSTVILSVIIISFCSLSVLYVLIRPGPGEQGGGRERVDQSKKKAFYMIMSILGVLVVRFTGGFLWAVLQMLGQRPNCVTVTSVFWFNLPSSLVLPLLFLYRSGKLVCCRKNNQ